MNTNATKNPDKPTMDVAAPLQIVLTYDHPSMATSARELLDGFLTKWAADVDTHRDEWSFAELEHPHCAREALELAGHCDVFIIALSGAGDLPVPFMEWFTDWLQSRAQVETAFIVLVSSHGANLSNLPRFASLPSLARAHGLPYFTTTVALPGTALPRALQPGALLSRLEAINPDLLPDFSGINE